MGNYAKCTDYQFRIYLETVHELMMPQPPYNKRFAARKCARATNINVQPQSAYLFDPKCSSVSFVFCVFCGSIECHRRKIVSYSLLNKNRRKISTCTFQRRRQSFALFSLALFALLLSSINQIAILSIPHAPTALSISFAFGYCWHFVMPWHQLTQRKSIQKRIHRESRRRWYYLICMQTTY